MLLIDADGVLAADVYQAREVLIPNREAACVNGRLVAILAVAAVLAALGVALLGRAERYHEHHHRRDGERHDPQDHRRCTYPVHYYILPLRSVGLLVLRNINGSRARCQWRNQRFLRNI